MNKQQFSIPILLLLLSLAFVPIAALAAAPTYDTHTLAGKVASIDNTPGLYLRASGFIEQEANMSDAPNPGPFTPITPSYVLSSPLDGTSIVAPDVTVNQDSSAATQNEPAVAVDPNNPNLVVAAANDYVTRTWSCTIGSTPCSALGDGYSGTYFSKDGGATWCCVATDPSNLGTLIPGVERLTGGAYDAGGDPSLAFNSQHNIFYAGLGFDRTAPPNTVEVSKGTFDGSGNLHWGSPTFINPTTSPSILNDKEWIGVDSHASSPFKDRVYVSWTRFIFNPATGAYVQSPIIFVFSTDGGETFSTPQSIVGNVLYDQGSRIVVGADGTVYVFWEGSTRLATFNSIYMSKSTDGGVSFSKPVQVSPLVDIIPPRYTVFRVNSFPAADISPSGQLYVAWSTEVTNGVSPPDLSPSCAFFIVGTGTVYSGCHAASVWSTSTDGGSTWNAPSFMFAQGTRSSVGYPKAQPTGGSLNAPSPKPIDSFFPGVAIANSGDVYLSAYVADVNSPWQRCATPATPTAVGRINCLALDNYINNGRLDYQVTDLTTAITKIVTTHPINTRYQFGGGFIGDYTSLAVGSDGNFHAVWTDTNNVQTVTWWYGFQFVPTSIHQQDIATASENF